MKLVGQGSNVTLDSLSLSLTHTISKHYQLCMVLHYSFSFQQHTQTRPDFLPYKVPHYYYFNVLMRRPWTVDSGHVFPLFYGNTTATFILMYISVMMSGSSKTGNIRYKCGTWNCYEEVTWIRRCTGFIWIEWSVGKCVLYGKKRSWCFLDSMPFICPASRQIISLYDNWQTTQRGRALPTANH